MIWDFPLIRVKNGVDQREEIGDSGFLVNRIQLPRKIHFAIELDGGAGFLWASTLPWSTGVPPQASALRHRAMGESDKSDWLYGKALLDRAVLTAESDRLVRNSS